MADASRKNTASDTRIELVQRLFRLIKDNSLEEIKNILKTLKPRKRIQILNHPIDGYIPLNVALECKNVEISRYLVDRALHQGPVQMSKSWKYYRHPIKAAIHSGKPELIELILQYLSDINEKIDGGFSPLMIATIYGNLMAVKMIVARGADIDWSGFNGRSSLMESTSNIEICRFLISQGANVNQQDEEGFTALHIAIARKHRENILHLVNAGANFRLQSYEGITPLMWCTINIDDETFKYLSKHPDCSALDKIEALEILNARLVCDQNSDIEQWREALKERTEKNLPKNCQGSAVGILDFSQEFRTEEELVNLKDKPLKLAYQSILVVERILGRNNRLYMLLLLQTALIVKKENELTKFESFMDYIQEYCLEASVFFVTATFHYFKSLFNDLGNGSLPKNVFEYRSFVIFNIIAQAAVKMWRVAKANVSNNPFLVDIRYTVLVDTFLYMASTIKPERFSPGHLSLFKEVVKKVVREDILFRFNQSILYHAIKMRKNQPWDSVAHIKILLESGADANCKDYFGLTPTIYAAKHLPEHLGKEVLALLIEYGGQPDSRCSESLAYMDGIL